MMLILTRKLDMMVARKGTTSESSSWRVEIDERQTEHTYATGSFQYHSSAFGHGVATHSTAVIACAVRC